MSQCSSCSYGSTRICRCGLVAKVFTAKTRDNAGRRFFKCPKTDSQSCGYWEWETEKVPIKAETIINDLRCEVEGLEVENNLLKKKIKDLEASAALDAGKIAALKERVLKQCIVIFLFLGCFIGFIGSWVIQTL